MEVGKLSQEKLNTLVFEKIRLHRKQVLFGAGIGEDCAVIDFGGEMCVLSTDPITTASAGAGALAVHVSANDVASAGAEPFALLATLLIPPKASEQELERVVDDLIATAERLGIDVIGGHTEVTDAVNRIVVSTTVLGKTKRPIKTAGAQPGDFLVLTKSAGLEGTAILAQDVAQAENVLSKEELAYVKGFSHRISVLPEARIAYRCGATAMHDVTEGGVLGAVYEMASASGVGVRIQAEAIPIDACTKKLCEAFSMDPLKLISSGSLLIAIEDAAPLLQAMQEQDIAASVIGRFTKERELLIKKGVELSAIAPPGSDEIYKVVTGKR